MVPESVRARGRGQGRLAAGFGRRFYWLLVMGLLWVPASWWAGRLVWGLVAWDVLLAAAWWVDLRSLPRPEALEFSRVWEGWLILGRPVRVRVEGSGAAINGEMVDETPGGLSEGLAERALVGGRAEYTLTPRERGDWRMGRLHVKYRSAWGLAERWAVADLEQTVRVLPDVLAARSELLDPLRSRQMEMERRQRRQGGLGRELEGLREYREGDEMRDVAWPATARRHQLITRTYRAERSQSVWVLLEAGRLMRAQVEGPVVRTKLDYAVDAALGLAQVAEQGGDRVGLLAYGRRMQQMVIPAKGAAQIRRLVEALAQVRAEASEANHAVAARTLLEKQTRRALVVWVTDFAETAALPASIEYAMQLRRRHLVLFAAIGQPDLVRVTEEIPQTEASMFRRTAALEIVERRHLLLRKLESAGVLVLEVGPEDALGKLVNEYLRIKERSLL